ncbi:MAG: hypothetical protein AAB801_02820, partial [Patescibacteria group bacterium]
QPTTLEAPAQIEQQPTLNTPPPQPATAPVPSLEQQPAQAQAQVKALPKVDLSGLPAGGSPNHRAPWERTIGKREEGKGRVELIAA